jgi:aldose 1-epimerase
MPECSVSPITMFSRAIISVLATATAVAAQKPDEDGRYTISAPGIKAQFIPYGASLTNLYVKDKNGEDVDVVLGYDDVDYYPIDPGHPVLNAIPGRYVNRIGHGQYTIGNTTFLTEKNDGDNTLHSGTNNWSFRDWEVTDFTEDSITFAIHDASNSSQGMIGDVDASVTYSVSDSTWKITMEATSPDALTPIMLTQHTYFNLDAYKDPETDKIWNHTLYMPYSQRYLVAGDDALPTGEIGVAAPGTINDFASEEGIQLGHASGSPEFPGNCGAGGACEGYNGQFLIDDAPEGAVVVSLASPFSGIKADLRTDQVGVVIYSCNWFDGSGPLKSTQGLEDRTTVTRSSCVAIEAHDYVDGINNPEWGRKKAQLTGPKETYTWESSWEFGLV